MPQSIAKENFYCALYYITLNSNCEAQRASKDFFNVEERVKSQNKCMSDLHVIFLFFYRENFAWNSLNKIRPQSPKEK